MKIWDEVATSWGYGCGERKGREGKGKGEGVFTVLSPLHVSSKS